MELTSHTAKGVNKLSRYGWTTKDQPGTLQMIHKDRLKIDDAYQRGLKWAAENDGSLNAGFNALLDLMRERAVEFFPKFAEAA